MTAPSLPRLPKRAPDSHKGNFGRAVLIGGSRGMSGAIALSGMATLRSGAGLVRLGVPDCCLETVASFEPSYMTVPLPCDERGRITVAATASIVGLAEGANCVSCGPGLGRSTELDELIDWMYGSITHPMVIDADGLNALANRPDGLAGAAGPRILTPHPGEFRRLVHEVNVPLLGHEQQAIELAAEHNLVLVLKGHRSLITDGARVIHNDTGNPGMATGGTGDVLTGIITALICQGLSAFDAAHLGVHVHGLAGDLAAEALGQVSMLARDLLTYLPPAFLRVAES